jgi:uncharacterized protein YlxW (UPF0749 family)
MQLDQLEEMAHRLTQEVIELDREIKSVKTSNHGNSKSVRLSRKIQYKCKLLSEVAGDIKKCKLLESIVIHAC